MRADPFTLLDVETVPYDGAAELRLENELDIGTASGPAAARSC